MTEQKLQELLQDMTLEEKVNQMLQLAGGIFYRRHGGHGADGGERIYAGEYFQSRFGARSIGRGEAEEDPEGFYGEASP